MWAKSVQAKSQRSPADCTGMDIFDRRRQVLVRAVRERDWCVKVKSLDGDTLGELAELGWVELEIDGDCYRHVVTKRGLERHASWGDERRQTLRQDSDEFPAAS